MIAAEPAPVTMIPAALIARDRWALWRYEQRPGEAKPTKVPYRPIRGGMASSNRPSDWGRYDVALAALEAGECKADGIGFLLGDGIVGIDLDGAVDEDGFLLPYAREMVAELGSYAEMTPSWRGIHILCAATLDGGRQSKGNGADVEIYGRGRFFTMTGIRLPEADEFPGIEPRQKQVDALVARLGGLRTAPDAAEVELGGEVPADKLKELLETDGRFAATWAGARSDLASASEKDLSVATIAANVGWSDEEIAALILERRRLAGEEPKKARRKDYVARTIAKARAAGSTEGPRRVASDPPPAAASGWPTLAKEALYGPLGELVDKIEPHTEADPVAILVQSMVAFGSVVGRGPHFLAERDEHHGNLFAALVGETSKGRKGTSWGQVQSIAGMLESGWQKRILGGLSSGEGLIWAVRDSFTTRVRGEEVIEPGVEDKRLLVFEGELAQAFKMMRREGNTLSPVVRSAWETGRLQSLTKNSPAAATGAHISIIGHITKGELLRQLSETEAGNGLGNRFLWVLVRRSKCLPEGGAIGSVDFGPLVRDLSAAVRKARTKAVIKRDDAARKLWAEVYPELSEGKPGLLGAMIGRAEAQTMRLALIFALADGSPVITREHLVAALALWKYCEASARYIFGDSLGDPVADEILGALRVAPKGLSRSALLALFGRNKSAGEIGRALSALVDLRLVACTRIETGGRPAEVWTLRAAADAS